MIGVLGMRLVQGEKALLVNKEPKTLRMPEEQIFYSVPKVRKQAGIGKPKASRPSRTEKGRY